ncbi:MAG TPA: hypothetical protein VIM98_08910 [Dyella sp.]|uniref:hypothetical protein n=1 Tax=Dyella sp. TaxID=1869338 RepID=UPI002F922430
MTSSLRVSLPWMSILLAGVAAALVRYLFIEPANLAHLCDEANGPAWCSVRQAIVFAFYTYGLGYAALASTALALAWKHPATACLAAALGFIALVMYCYEAGALALLVGSLRLIRLQSGSQIPTDQHRGGNRQVQQQP